jgi:low affinity Fe/Cu permease
VLSTTNRSWFTAFAQWASRITGRPIAFIAAVAVLLLWCVSGPVFGFSDTWQLVINTGTTIVTFLMVFVIQNTQNRDTAAMQLKLDELIRVNRGARNVLLDLEELDESVLQKLRGEYEVLAEEDRVTHGPSLTPPHAGARRASAPRRKAKKPRA